MSTQIFILAVSICLIILGALWSTKYAAKFAENFHVSKFIIGLIIVAVISILPETFISINAVFEGVPGLGLGTLFSSNVADLSLAFGIIILFSGRKFLKIESKVLKTDAFFPLFLLLPIILGLDGHYGRLEGVGLISIGILFYYLAFRNGLNEAPAIKPQGERWKNLIFLLGSIVILLLGSHFAVSAGIEIANLLHINPILIGIFIIGLGTIVPELVFAFQAVKRYDDSLAIGDLLGTVLADATIVVGILALISPFSVPQKIIYITGGFMLLASFLISYFMHTGKQLTKKEGIIMICFWALFVLTEYLVNS